MQPLPELPASVEVTGAGSELKLQVLDISVGGVGLWTQRGKLDVPAGETIALALVLGGKPAQVQAVVRHASPDGTLHGVEFLDVSEEARSVIHRYVAELTERGASV